MADSSISIDSSQVIKAFISLVDRVNKSVPEVAYFIGSEILLASRPEVPFLTGELSDSGEVVQDGNDAIVAYQAPYAAYQHEGRRADGSHVIQNYSNGRKGKYLEDPIANNLDVLNNHAGVKLQQVIG